MTDEEIRQLDNHELDEEAFRLGLAPADIVPILIGLGRRMFLRHGPLRYKTLHVAWSPATVRADAAACLDVVRARGYATSTTWEAGDGLVQIFAGDQLGLTVACWEASYTTAQEEAHALLLCAVLALSAREASQR